VDWWWVWPSSAVFGLLLTTSRNRELRASYTKHMLG